VVTVAFTPNLARHVACPTVTVPGTTVAEALDAVFQGNPRLRGYVVDEQGALRHHMVVFVNGQQIRDRVKLTDPLPIGAELYVMQALSGG
jgi:sulfur-carrier protein